ncbi:MAG: hypothetical protein KKE50_05795 [Nanoarchaeota archaeon]|nr:hypothetical protein [Nanoarchaeota archaeon]
MCLGDNPGLRALPYAISGAIFVMASVVLFLLKRKALPWRAAKICLMIVSALVLLMAYLELNTFYKCG